MKRILCLVFVGGCYACGQTVLVPVAATFVDGHGRIARIHGVLGSLLPPEFTPAPSESAGESILSAAFDVGGLLKTASHLVVLDSSGGVVLVQTAPGGSALFNFAADGTPAWVFYPVDEELVSLTSRVSIRVDGVTALGPAGVSSIPVLTSSGQQFWSALLSIPDGVISNDSAVPGTPPAVWFRGGWLTCSSTGIYWTPLEHGTSAQEIALPEAVHSMQNAGHGSVAINGAWLLNARFQLVEIPGISQRARSLEVRP